MLKETNGFQDISMRILPWLIRVSFLSMLPLVWSQLHPGSVVSSTNITLYEQYLESCKGVVIDYQVREVVIKIIPFSDNHETQPYKFSAECTLTNTGYDVVTGWELFVGFQHDEVISEAHGVIFLNGETPPGAYVGNGTTIVGLTTPDLLTSIDTAEDFTLISVNFTLTGTEFGVGPEDLPKWPMPDNLTILNPGYLCDPPEYDEGSDNHMFVCCAQNDAELKFNETDFLPRETGDITIYYDVLETKIKEYTAQVSMSLDEAIGRFDHWNLTWDWRNGEFIWAMKGAQTLEQDQSLCSNGPAAKIYTDLDFFLAMSCQVSPTIVDLSPDKLVDPSLAVKYCCRNGTLLPKLVDPAQTKAAFTVEVYKTKNLARNSFAPPFNWRIGDLNKGDTGYRCGKPRRVAPSEFDEEDSLHYTSAVASWEITCNQSAPTGKEPRKCCVSFSGYYNGSVIPCPTCACGCAQRTDPVCNPNIEQMLLPSYGLLLPASNRTTLALQLAQLKHYAIPEPLPCPDNCGVSINWHVYSNYEKGWSARMTLFNWNVEPVINWFAAVDIPKAIPGYQNVYSFNGSLIEGVVGLNNTLFIQAHTGYFNNYLLGLDKGLVPGKLQSLMSFDKRKTPGIDVIHGDGFPTRVWFNGDECMLPDLLPVNEGHTFLPPPLTLAIASLISFIILLAD